MYGALWVLKEAIHVYLNISMLVLSSCGDWNFPGNVGPPGDATSPSQHAHEDTSLFLQIVLSS